MKSWILLIAMIAVSWLPATASASSRAQYRAQIRATPILNRPYRPGHFYGNTVRRRHARQYRARR